MPDPNNMPSWDETVDVPVLNESELPSWDETEEVKKKDDLEVGSGDFQFRSQDGSSQLNIQKPELPLIENKPVEIAAYRKIGNPKIRFDEAKAQLADMHVKAPKPIGYGLIDDSVDKDMVNIAARIDASKPFPEPIKTGYLGGSIAELYKAFGGMYKGIGKITQDVDQILGQVPGYLLNKVQTLNPDAQAKALLQEEYFKEEDPIKKKALGDQINVMRNEQNMFTQLGDWYEKSAEDFRPMPNDIAGGVATGVAQTIPLFLELSVTPEVKASSLLGKLFTSKLGVLEGAKGWYKGSQVDGTAKDRLKGGFMGGLGGYGYGTVLHGMGVTSSELGNLAKEITKSNVMRGATATTANSVLFGGYDAYEQYVNTGTVDGRRVATSMGVGAALGLDPFGMYRETKTDIKNVKRAIEKKAYENAFNKFMESSDQVIEFTNKQNIEPFKLREESNRLGELALNTDNVEEKNRYLSTKNVIDNMISINAISNDVITNPDNYRGLINKSDLPEEQKEIYIKKINKVVQDNMELQADVDSQILDARQTAVDSQKNIKDVTSTVPIFKEPELFIDENTKLVFNNIAENLPVTNERLHEASNNLYQEYKRLETVKLSKSRTNTIDEINEAQKFLENEITNLENQKKVQKEKGMFINLRGRGKVKEGEKPVSPKQELVDKGYEPEQAEKMIDLSNETKNKPQPEKVEVEVPTEKPPHEIAYEESISKKSPEVIAQMPTWRGKKFSLATILPNGDISNVYVRNEGESHKTYMSPEDAKAYENGEMTVGFWNNKTQSFIEAPQKGFEFGQRVMDIASSSTRIELPKPVENIKSFTERIKSGDKMDSPEDIQFYENNKKEIELELQKGGQENAIQEQVTNEMDVRQQAEDGEGMGGRNPEYQEPTRQNEEAPLNASGNVPGSQSKEAQVDPEIAIALRKFAGKVREGKISKIQGFKASSPFSMAWDGGLEVLAKSLEVTADVTVAISKALAYMKNTDWYKGLSKGRQKEFDEKFTNHINSELGIAEPRLSGIKKSLVPEEKIEDVEIEHRTKQQMLERGKNLVESGEIMPHNIIEEVNKSPRALQPDEVASLVYYKTKLDNNYDEVYDRLVQAQNSGNIEAEIQLKNTLQGIDKAIDNYHETSLRTAYEQSLAFSLRQMMVDSEFNLQHQIRKYKAVNKGEIPPEVADRFKELDQRFKDVNKKIRDFEKDKGKVEGEEAIKAIKAATQRDKKPKVPTTKVPEIKDGKLTIHPDIIKEYVEKGMDDINEIVSAIKKDYDLEATDREIRDAITDYGKQMSMSKDEIDMKVRELKRMGRTISGLEDVLNEKKKPLRSGLQRDKPTDRERRLQKLLRDAMKELPQTEEESAQHWKSALDGIKTRLNNQISDLQNQIETGARTPKKKGIEYDAEAEALREQRDALQEVIRQIDGKKEISDEQKVKMAIASAEKWAKEYERRIAENDFSPLRKPSNVPNTPELAAARARLNDLKTTLKQMMDEQGVTEKKRVDIVKKNLAKSIVEYNRRIREKDYTPRTKRTPPKLDREAIELEIERNRVKYEYEKIQEENRLANRPLQEKMTEWTIDILNLPKSLKASADLSAPLRQGAVLFAGNPKIGSRAFIEMFKFAGSQKKYDRWLEELNANPDFDIIRKSKLYVSEPTSKLSAKEEQFITNIAYKIPGWGRIVKVSERAYTGFLNKLRVDVFLQGADHLNSLGYDYRTNPEMYKQWANFVNNAAGRGNLGMLESSAPFLNTFFFSPRLVASRFNLLNPFNYAEMPKEVRKMALRNVGSFIGMGLTVLALAKAAGAEVEDDPRSADFGKIKIGKWRFDIWAGFQQIVVMLAKLSTGSVKNTRTGKIEKKKATKFPYDSTRLDALTNFVENKFSPTISTGKAILKGVNRDFEPVTPLWVAKSLMAPIYLEDIRDIYKEEGLLPTVGGNIPNLFGVGTQYYKPTKKSSVSTFK